MGKLISMIDFVSDARMVSPEQAIRYALDAVSPGGENENCKKVLIVMLDDSDKNYDVWPVIAGISGTEAMGLMDVAKAAILDEMGY